MKYLVICIAAFVACACGMGTNTTPPNAGTSNNGAASLAVQATPAPTPARSEAFESIYTGHSRKTCREIKGSDEPGLVYKAECNGVGGYKVITQASEHSEALTVIDSKGRSTDLDLRSAVRSAAPFNLGDKIEWRMTGKGGEARPAALIIRLNLHTDPYDSNKRDSHLIVAKMTDGAVCVSDVVPSNVPDQNVRARELADTAKDRPCIVEAN